MIHPLEALQRWIGDRLSRYLSQRTRTRSSSARNTHTLLIEGRTRISAPIKYLTQSIWSHAAIYVGDIPGRERAFIEVDLREGVRAVGVDAYAGLHCRICRPVGMTAVEIEALVSFVTQRIGYRYDLKNVFDLARYLLPFAPVPSHLRRRMIALGSGDPTRAICSQAFESVRYPILPIIERVPSGDPLHPDCIEEILHVRSYTLYVPRDFDVSPYFAIVKPTLASGFDFRRLAWDDRLTLPGA